MIPGVRDTELPYINRGLACKTVAHEHQDLKGNTPVHRQPVQFRTDELRYMSKLRNPTNQSSSSIQNRLQLINICQRYTSVNCTTIIYSRTDKCMHEGPGSFKGQRAAYRTNLPQMVKTRATYTTHMPGKGQFLIQGHPQVLHSSGKQDTREAFQQDGKINFWTDQPYIECRVADPVLTPE